MLENFLDTFEKQDMLKIVLDGYIPADGDYFVMELKEDTFHEKIHLQIRQDKKTRTLNITPAEKLMIAKLDYYCRLLEMNKYIGNKIIHSNNFLSFWLKKENLTSGKLTQDVIDKYYEILAEPRLKYKNRKDLELYERVEAELGSVNRTALAKVKEWISKNIFQYGEHVTGKDYLKFFFLIPDTDIQSEGKRYWLPNLYNKNDFNVNLQDQIYGVPNNNMQMNSKKPFLEYKHRMQKVPTLENLEQVMKKKYFFDYLMNCAASGAYNVYLKKEKEETEYKFHSYKNKELPRMKDGTGFYLRVAKEKNEAEIVRMDGVTRYRSDLVKPLTVKNITDVNAESLKEPLYMTYRTLHEVSQLFDRVFFTKYLSNNFFTDPKDITGIDSKVKENLLLSRNALFHWFYLGNSMMIRSIWNRVTNTLICNSIQEGRITAVNHQFNVRLALQDFFEGGEISVGDIMVQVRERIRVKMNSKEYQSIENDEEYYYACGQLLNYLISRNKTKKRPHSFVNGFLNVTKDKVLKDRLTVLFKKYNYDIDAKSLRFNNLYNMVISYQTENKVMQDYMIAGYISNSLVYEKGEKGNE